LTSTAGSNAFIRRRKALPHFVKEADDRPWDAEFRRRDPGAGSAMADSSVPKKDGGSRRDAAIYVATLPVSLDSPVPRRRNKAKRTVPVTASPNAAPSAQRLTTADYHRVVSPCVHCATWSFGLKADSPSRVDSAAVYRGILRFQGRNGFRRTTS